MKHARHSGPGHYYVITDSYYCLRSFIDLEVSCVVSNLYRSRIHRRLRAVVAVAAAVVDVVAAADDAAADVVADVVAVAEAFSSESRIGS